MKTIVIINRTNENLDLLCRTKRLAVARIACIFICSHLYNPQVVEFVDDKTFKIDEVITCSVSEDYIKLSCGSESAILDIESTWWRKQKNCNFEMCVDSVWDFMTKAATTDKVFLWNFSDWYEKYDLKGDLKQVVH